MNTKQKLAVMKQNEEANKRHVEEWKKEMQKEKLLAVFVDVYNECRARKIRVDHDLEAWYKLLDCQWVEMPLRWIGDKPFIIICDEEGTFRSDCKVSARNGDEVMLVGNLLVVAEGDTEEGDIRGLTEQEAKYVMDHVRAIARMDKNGALDLWQVLTDVKYFKDE